jgi:hypothetical protein
MNRNKELEEEKGHKKTSFTCMRHIKGIEIIEAVNTHPELFRSGESCQWGSTYI